MSDHEGRIEVAARAICAAAGKDPNEMLPTGGMEPVADGTMVTLGPVMVAAWQFHKAEASKLIAVFDALSVAKT